VWGRLEPVRRRSTSSRTIVEKEVNRGMDVFTDEERDARREGVEITIWGEGGGGGGGGGGGKTGLELWGGEGKDARDGNQPIRLFPKGRPQ